MEIILGMDEVGRGPLAGPVCVCAFAFLDNTVESKLEGITDSKKISPKKRLEWVQVLDQMKKDNLVAYSIGLSDAKYIDEFGIKKGILSASTQCLDELEKTYKVKNLLIDYSLAVPDKYDVDEFVKGDERFKIISAASIIAKVHRDSLMDKYDEKYPGYAFATNKGYGTKQHIEGIKELGKTDIHRKTFIHF